MPFFIYHYPPAWAHDVDGLRDRVITKLRSDDGLNVVEINLYDLTIEMLQARGVWERRLKLELEQGKDALIKPLQNMLDPGSKLIPAIKERLDSASYDVLVLTGIGEVFPYIRSHNVLNNLQSVVTGKPMLMFFPGRYEQSDTLGSSLVLFGRLKDDQYYRAKNILEQEA